MRLHEDEVATSEELVRSLVAEQFPAWAHLPVRALPVGGTDNAIFRLGDELAVRLPRRGDWRPESLDKELTWLPRLAPHLPLPIPAPVARGVPGAGYPLGWAVVRWLPGEDGTVAQLDLARAAVDLAGLLSALARIDASGGPVPAGRGGPLEPRDPFVRESVTALGRLVDAGAVLAAWEDSLAAPVWDGPPVWVHGDLDLRNLLVQDGRITGVLDWGSCAIGDPACDVKVAWAVLDAPARRVFRKLLAVDDATWARGRGWAVSQAVIALAYYLDTYPAIVEQAWGWLREALAGE